MTLRAETRVDRSTAAIAVERSARDGVVHLRCPLTWIGVRTYRDAATGALTRELRRPEQVWSASHIETLKRLTCTHGHPSERWEGAVLPVMLDARADAGSGPGEDGTLRRPPGVLQVGQTGDLIERVEIDGAPLPVAGVAIHGAAAIADIEGGKTQTSLGYGCLVDHTPGTWTDSSGRAWDYDAEHVLDALDPRVVAAAAEGFDPATLGANHLAVAISRGRGGPMSELLPRLDAWIEDADPPAVRDDLGEPRMFSMVRGADESGVSGVGRVMDGVVWPDGTVATRWRTVTASDGGFADWTTFHRIHVCAHPDNATELPFADGEDAPPCLACKARDAVAAARTMGDADEAGEAAPYPFGVRTISLPAHVKGLADKVAPLLGSKVAVKSDGLEMNIPPELAGPIADALMAMAEQIKGMSGELMEADAAIGAQAAELATAKEATAQMQADAALVAPLLADARKAKRDALVIEATKVAGGKLDVADDLDDAGIRKAAIAKRLGAAFPRLDSVDAVSAAFLALSTAGGKDPAEKPPVPQPIVPAPAKPAAAVIVADAEQRGDSHKSSALYDE